MLAHVKEARRKFSDGESDSQAGHLEAHPTMTTPREKGWYWCIRIDRLDSEPEVFEWIGDCWQVVDTIKDDDEIKVLSVKLTPPEQVNHIQT